jgi:AcrR family transcriptional regulator
VTTRAYESPLRAEQAERTRDAILAAFAEQMAEARDEFSIPRVAKRAGVSTRTVYHHFPNREAQVEALATWIEQRLGAADGPRDLHDLPDYQARMCRRFLDNEALIRAQLAAGIATRVRARRRRAREAQIDACVAPYVPEEREAKVLGAFLKQLISAQAGLVLLDQYGIARDDVFRVFPWAVRVITEAIERGDLPSGPRRRKRSG